MQGDKKIYFITDLHLGVPTLEDSHRRELMLVSFLDSIKDNTETLFLMGDLFDFWFEYKTVVPRGYVRLLGKLAQFVDEGIPVHLFAGNHDLWTFDYLQKEIGIQVHREPMTITLKNKKEKNEKKEVPTRPWRWQRSRRQRIQIFKESFRMQDKPVSIQIDSSRLRNWTRIEMVAQP